MLLRNLLIPLICLMYAINTQDTYLVKDRWILDFKVTSVPAFFTYTYPDGTSENYFYFTFALKFEKSFFDEYKKEKFFGDRPIIYDSETESFVKIVEQAPLQFFDVKILCVNAIKTLTTIQENDHKVYEYQYNDLILTSVINKKIEYKILEKILKITSYPTLEKKKFIKKKKRKGEFLNLNELRIFKNHIKKSESISGIVYFRNFPVTTTSFKIIVTGIIDPIFSSAKKTSEISDIGKYRSSLYVRTDRAAEISKNVIALKRFEVEDRYIVIDYDFRGDPYEKHLDMPKFIESKIVSRKVGGAIDNKTLDSLFEILLTDKNMLNRLSVFNLLKILLPPEIFPECLVAKEYRCLKKNRDETIEEVKKRLLDIATKKDEIDDTIKKLKERPQKLDITCLKENYGKLCLQELQFNWFKFRDKISFNPNSFLYELKE